MLSLIFLKVFLLLLTFILTAFVGESLTWLGVEYNDETIFVACFLVCCQAPLWIWWRDIWKQLLCIALFSLPVFTIPMVNPVQCVLSALFE
jgi:hypothetical protein